MQGEPTQSVSQGWRGFNLQPDNFPACASPGSSGRISLCRAGREGADGQRTLKFCLLAVAGLGWGFITL